jgi:ABC-type Fe3+ transport system permease subunit
MVATRPRDTVWLSTSIFSDTRQSKLARPPVSAGAPVSRASQPQSVKRRWRCSRELNRFAISTSPSTLVGTGFALALHYSRLSCSRLVEVALALPVATSGVVLHNVMVTLFLAAPSQTLPIWVLNQMRFGFTPTVNAVFVVLAVACVLLVRVATRTSKPPSGSAR